MVHTGVANHDWFNVCASHWGPARAVDLFKLAQQSQTLHGACALNLFARAIEGLPEQPWVRSVDQITTTGTGVVWFSCQGSEDLQHRLWLDLTVVVKVNLQCQRCLTPFVYEVNEQIRFQVVRYPDQLEDDSDELDPDAPEKLLGSSRFDVMSLIEDQIVLGLPYVPKHEICPEQALGGTGQMSLRSERQSDRSQPGSKEDRSEDRAENRLFRESPFAVLKSLKNKDSPSGSESESE